MLDTLILTAKLTLKGTTFIELDVSAHKHWRTKPLAAEAAFKLVRAAAYGGAFASLIWDMSSLLTNSRRRILARLLNPRRSNFALVLSGDVLTVSWILEPQRLDSDPMNSPGVVLSTKWVDVHGSTGTSAFSIRNDPSLPSALSRLGL